MLYIFQVDSGTMITLDMNLALETVEKLKQVICQIGKIPEEKQVLLISGGYSLDPATRVCNYSAGTDTSPIFLFNKVAIEDPVPPVGTRWENANEDMKEKVEGSLSMPPTYNTIVSRTQLAQRFYELAKEGKTSCERLVLDQHLMQQGWAAVIANLDDVTRIFKVRSEKFEKTFNQYLQTRQYNINLLENFSRDLAVLSKIPVLPILLKACQGQTDSSETVNLLYWISSKDNQNNLEQIADISKKGIEKFDEEILHGLMSDVDKALRDIDKAEMKEIKGLEERLCGLEQLMFQAKKTVEEQGGLAQAFLHNQNRVSSLKDPSIFPDLCASHKQQLLMLLQNHDRLIDIHRRCLVAKKELRFNLHTRLRWIMWVEGQLSDIDNKLSIYIENLKRIKSHLEVVHQIHLAPRVYLASVCEVVRRREFSSVFLKWARQLSTLTFNLLQKETETRKKFNSQLTNHFLVSLFPGMDDNPPAFATESPKEFDSNLPPVDSADIELLRQALPEFVSYLQEHLQSPSLNNLISLPLAVNESPTPVSASTQTVTSESGLDTLSQSSSKDGGGGGVPKKQHSISEIFSPISEEVWLGEDFETVAVDKEELEGVEPTKLVTIAAASEPGPAEKCQELQLALHRAHSQGDIESSPVELPSVEPTDFTTADFYIDESMPSSYTESNGTSGLARSATGAHMTKSHHVVVAELQKQLDDKVMSISSMQEDLKAKNDQLEKHTSSFSTLKNTLHELVLKDRQSLFQLKQRILEDKTRFNGEIGEMVNNIAAVFFELKNELENEKNAKNNLEKTIQERILNDLAALDDIFYHDKELERYIRENNIDLIAEDTKIVDFKTLFEIRRELEQKRVREQLLVAEERAAYNEKRYKDLSEEYMTLSNYAKELEAKLQNASSNWEEARVEQQRNQLLFEQQKANEILNLQLTFEKEYREKLWRARKSLRLTPCRLSFEEVNNLWSNAGQNAMSLILSAWSAERDKLVQICARLRQESTSSESLMELVTEALVSVDRRSQEVCQAQWEFWKMENGTFRQKCLEYLREIKKQCAQSDSLKLEGYDAALKNITSLLMRCVTTQPSNPPPTFCTTLLQDSIREFQRVQKGQLDSEKQKNKAIVAQLKEQIRMLRGTSENVDKKSNLAILSEFDPFDKNQMGTSLQTEQSQAKSPDWDQYLGATGSSNSKSISSPSSSSASKSLPPTSPSRDPISSPTNKVSVLKCCVNDVVLLTYDEKHENYVVFILDSTPHFLNQDCHAELGLTLEAGRPRRAWALGVVVDKEYCKAKKVPNRYRVPLESRFYRVAVKPCPWLYSINSTPSTTATATSTLSPTT